MKAKQGKRNKQTVSSIIKNNFFVLGIVWKLSKLRFLLKFLMTVVNALLPTLKIMITWYIIAAVENNTKNKAAFETDMLPFK